MCLGVGTMYMVVLGEWYQWYYRWCSILYEIKIIGL